MGSCPASVALPKFFLKKSNRLWKNHLCDFSTIFKLLFFLDKYPGKSEIFDLIGRTGCVKLFDTLENYSVESEVKDVIEVAGCGKPPFISEIALKIVRKMFCFFFPEISNLSKLPFLRSSDF